MLQWLGVLLQRSLKHVDEESLAQRSAAIGHSARTLMDLVCSHTDAPTAAPQPASDGVWNEKILQHTTKWAASILEPDATCLPCICGAQRLHLHARTVAQIETVRELSSVLLARPSNAAAVRFLKVGLFA